MIRMLIVVPYRELYDLVQDYARDSEISQYEVRIEHLFGSECKKIKDCDADIVVARGMTAKAIARANPHVHMVEISISISDLIEALLECREIDNGKGVGVILTNPDICDPILLQDLVGFPIYLRSAEDEAELYAAISELYTIGIRTFIGGLTLCRRCEDLGLRYFHIKSGKEAVLRALSEALAAAKSLDRERAKTNLISTVLNNAEDAMLAIDNSGIIFASNSQASALFVKDKDKSLEGLRLSKIFPDIESNSCLKELSETGTIFTIGEQLILIKKTPLIVNEESFGVLITCRNVEALRETERNIQKALSNKGLLAHYTFSDIIFKSGIMQSLIASAYKYSQVDSNLLIAGETGTGKELFAQSIHNASKRCTQPFVAVNCAALPEQLLESELFGYTEGAFSGAVKGGRVGLFELAHRGTIFLDEIGEMPLNLQAKILRVLEEKEIRKIGGDTVVPIDVRVISATNIDMNERIRKGQFRKDLYYRINLLNLSIPPLRQRPEDIEILFLNFMRRFASRCNIREPKIDSDVMRVLCRYPWYGNIRELRNLCERLIILNDGNCISSSMVESMLSLDNGSFMYLQETATEVKREIHFNRIGDAGDSYATRLAASGKSHKEFAASLGISRTTLWRRLKQEQKVFHNET